MRLKPLLLSTLLLAGSLSPSLAFAAPRGFGGFRAPAGRPGGGWGGGSYHFQNNDVQRGYSGYHPMYGDGARPAWNNGSVDRTDINRSGVNGTDLNRTDINRGTLNNNLDGNRNSFNNDTFNRNVNVNNNFYNRNYNGWNNNWRNGGYWNNRPWNTGWYGGWGGWGWWGGSAAAWGIAGLATGAAIASLVNSAADQQSTVIVVPQTSYELNYGSVEAVGNTGASFSYNVDGSTLMGAVNCQQGLLNGQVPGTADQAQLLNAVCQVAYGSGG
jgi:hypothetical protein